MPLPPFTGNISFNAHHSPMGAYFTFTCGHFSTQGGLAAELGKPARQDIFIGVKLGGRHDKGPIRCLPFFNGAQALMQDAQLAFTLERPDGQTDALAAYNATDISRQYGWASDIWTTPDLEFAIRTPFGEIPDPARSAAGENAARLRQALLPAVTAELTIDNRAGTHAKTAFFAINFNEGGARLLDQGLAAGRVGFALRAHTGVTAEAVDTQSGAPAGLFPIMRWSVQQGLEDRSNPVHLLGTHPGVAVEVPAGKSVTLRLALGCHLAGIVTTRLPGRYFYTRHYGDLIEVLNESLNRFDALKAQSQALDEKLLASGLSADQQFLIAHAARSYYGNTQLLEIDGESGPEPYWIVNEGEYCMMNTLDLSVDQMFWELEYNPWVVRNLLDNFVKRYSYRDQVKHPNTGEKFPGGISFAHDQGVNNQFSPFGTSSYELKDLTACFSYMTQEQLCNWILMAAAYFADTGDQNWLATHRSTLRACAQSMLNRSKDHSFAAFDSSLTGTGSEITTYDSLDHSLASTRNNAYMAVKCWAAWTGLSVMVSEFDDQIAEKAYENAIYCSNSIAAQLISGVLPAIFEKDSPGFPSRILPAVEGLIYPQGWKRTRPSGHGESEVLAEDFKNLHHALRIHTITLLSDPDRRNHFPDAGIKLSSTSDNSWLSKIAIVQHVARRLFNLDENGKERPQISTLKSQISDSGPAAHGWEKADAAHVKWLTTGESAFWAASDQIISGTAKGSRYYPRLITAALWLNTPGMPQNKT